MKNTTTTPTYPAHTSAYGPTGNKFAPFERDVAAIRRLVKAADSNKPMSGRTVSHAYDSGWRLATMWLDAKTPETVEDMRALLAAL